MKRHSVWCFSLGVVLSLGLAGLGCSSSNSPSVDAGKKDGSAGSGGKGGSTGGGGSGGTSAAGGVTGNGGSSSGGNSGSGGSASGGSSGDGGSSAGGSSAGGSSAGGSGGSVGGAGGSNVGGANGGSTGTGGSGAGGSSSIDGGSVDTSGSDASDAPLGQDASIDTGTVSLDTGALDVAEDMATPMDTGIDISPVDMSGIDGGNAIPCSEVKIIPPGTGSGAFATKGNFCFATCDDIAGWGVSNFEGRTLLLINGQEVAISSAGAMPLPTPKVAGYTVFQVNGSDSAVDYASVYWWGTAATSCTAPAGGFGLN